MSFMLILVFCSFDVAMFHSSSYSFCLTEGCSVSKKGLEDFQVCQIFLDVVFTDRQILLQEKSNYVAGFVKATRSEMT